MKETIILCDHENVEGTAQKAKKFNFWIEVQWFYKPILCEDEKQIEFQSKIIEDINTISFHSIFWDLCPWSGDPMIRDVAKNRFELSYKVANKINASHMVFHIGRVPGAGVAQRRSSRCVDFWNDFLQWKPDTMNYYIENQFDSDPEVIALVIDWIDKKNVKACLDIGHAHCHSKLSVVERIKILKDKIGYVHIHDNHGEKDEHLWIGKWTIPMNEVFDALNTYAPDALWALECATEDMEASIERLQKNNFL